MYGKLLRLIRKTMIPGFIVTLLLVSPMTVRGDYDEDFSTDLSEWTLYSQNEEDTTNHSWQIIDGALTSTGVTPTEQFIELNVACHDTGYDNGIFEYDFFGPEGLFRIGFRIARNYGINETDGIPLLPNPSHIQIIANMGLDNNGFPDGGDPTVHVGSLFNNGETWRGWNRIGDVPSLNESDIRGWHHIRIMKNDTDVEVYLDEIHINGGQIVYASEDIYDSICIWMDKGTGAAIDNIHISDYPFPLSSEDDSNEDDTNYPQLIMFTSLGLISISAVTIGGRSVYKKKLIKKAIELRKLNLETIRGVNHEFELSDASIYALTIGASKVSEYYSEEKIKELLPQDILAYRYLMHPIRLTILKLLNSEDKMKSADIKHILDITWGEYGNHIKSLEQKGYVEVTSEFNEDGNVVQVVYLHEFGRKQFNQLVALLTQFVAKSSPFEYLMYAQANLKDKDLYPDKTGFE